MDFYEKLYYTAVKNSADIAIASIVRYKKDRRKFFLKIENEVVTTDMNLKFELCNIPAQNYIWNKIYRLSEIRYNKLRFVEGKFYEDIIFTPQAVYCLDKLVTVPNVCYFYRENSGSIVSHRGVLYERDRVFAEKIAYDFMLEHGFDMQKFASLTRRFRFFGLTIFKIKRVGNVCKYYLFNVCIYKKSC